MNGNVFLFYSLTTTYKAEYRRIVLSKSVATLATKSKVSDMKTWCSDVI